MKRLESLDAWRVAQELSHRAYLLTTAPALSRHFALVDQIRRAAISIPANIAEGYALGTTVQFVRCLRIALGSAAELYTHLGLLGRLELLPTPGVQEAVALCDRVLSMIIGLLRTLARRTGDASRFPRPASRSGRRIQ